METENNNEVEAARERMSKIATGQSIVEKQQNFGLAILLGLVAAIIGAIVWCAISVITDYQIGYMAVAAGVFVAFVIRSFGKGLQMKYALLGGTLALLSCVLGNALIISYYISSEFSLSFLDSFITFFLNFRELYLNNLESLDFVFYVIAFGAAFQYSTVSYSTEQLETIAST